MPKLFQRGGVGCLDPLRGRRTEGITQDESPSVDDLIADIESRGLGWSLDHTGRLIEARIWDWPTVIGRYRPEKTVPLAKMLSEAMDQVDWSRYPESDDGGKG